MKSSNVCHRSPTSRNRFPGTGNAHLAPYPSRYRWRFGDSTRCRRGCGAACRRNPALPGRQPVGRDSGKYPWHSRSATVAGRERIARVDPRTATESWPRPPSPGNPTGAHRPAASLTRSEHLPRPGEGCTQAPVTSPSGRSTKTWPKQPFAAATAQSRSTAILKQTRSVGNLATGGEGLAAVARRPARPAAAARHGWLDRERERGALLER